MYRLFVALALLGFNAPALAETITIPVGQQGHETTAMPSRGESKLAVLERFGLADEEHPAVGQPPIMRWDYRTFSVYFESDRVINSVRHHQRTHPLQTEAQP